MAALDSTLEALASAGLRIALEAPDGTTWSVGSAPPSARVRFRVEEAWRALERGDLLALAEGYLHGQVDVDGDFLEVVAVTEVLAPDPTPWERLRLGAKLLLRNRRRLQRESIAFHYDRPPEFFLPWFERWRSYSHGLYETPDDAPEVAQERKLARAVGALGLEPGMHAFDMGCGWGSFLEYAGLRGIHVHGITISGEQHAFVEALIRDRNLPCSVTRVDFLDYQPSRRFDAAVFMGTLEHFADYRRAAAFLSRQLQPGGRVWADFVTDRRGHQVGAFLGRHIFPGTATYVRVPKLLDALIAEGFNVHEFEDDTLSYAFTCRDWADALEREHKTLAERFGEPAVRAFQVYLRASQHYLARNKTQAYHLVAGLSPAERTR